MQVPLPPVDPIIDNPIGELLLETVKNAPILPVSLMEAVATYVEYQSRPVVSTHPAKLSDKLFGKK